MNEIVEQLLVRYPVLASCEKEIQKAFELIRDAYREGGMLLVCGNGGSGADSEHIVGELMKEFARKRPLGAHLKEKLKNPMFTDGELLAEHLQGALPAVPLTGSLALSTAYANDAVPELVFAQQVMGYGDSRNVCLGISTSGNSRNVICAQQTAKALGMRTVGLTGRAGGALHSFCDACICVPADETPEIQELHLPVYHALCRMLEEEFFG